MAKSKIPISNKGLLKEALTHRSWINEHPQERTKSNERLEFLGDAALELVITEYLFDLFPAKDEGTLTSLRASLVRTETLSQVARDLNLGAKLRLSRGEELTGGRENPSLLANTLEAIIGALYVEKGKNAVVTFANTHLVPKLDKIIANNLDRDAKSLLQEKVQAEGLPAPTYKVEKEVGPDHNKTFVVSVNILGKRRSLGKGKSKQFAQQAAARTALEKFYPD